MVSVANAPTNASVMPERVGTDNVAPGGNTQATKLPDQPHQAPKSKTNIHKFLYFTDLVWEKATIIGLAIVAAHNLLLTLRFIIVDYPVINEDFAKHTITDTQIRLFLSDALALMVTTLISILLAIRLTKAQDRWYKFIELLFGTSIIVFEQVILDFLRGLDYSLISSTLREFILSLFS